MTGESGLRCGFTTGSCAAAAAKAALLMLLTGEKPDTVRIETPEGLPFLADLTGCAPAGPGAARCGVVKDGGDDPDITTGSVVYALVQWSDVPGIRIEGGEGIGRVTLPGLDQPVGAAAINSVPRRMILKNLEEVLGTYQGTGSEPKGLDVIISIPGGEELAKKTFNPRLGIVGGLSVLGTTGIVKPMSEDAVRETIRIQICMQRAVGFHTLLCCPGNFGMHYLTEECGIQPDRAVPVSRAVPAGDRCRNPEPNCRRATTCLRAETVSPTVPRRLRSRFST